MTTTLALQLAFPGICPVTEAVEKLATQGSIEERGAIYTKREVVEFILNLVGFKSNAPLLKFRLLEPSFGHGDFLLPAIDRLLAVAAQENALSVDQLSQSIRAVELHRPTFKSTKKLVIAKLRQFGMSFEDANLITENWLLQGDFLLSEFQNDFTHIVGNPPYVRQEAIPNVLMAEYRMRYTTIYDRADIYVPFIERSLNLLTAKGKLGTICADRWMKNKYGKKLRELVSRDYSLTTYVDMNDVDAFHAEVSALSLIHI